MLSKFKAFLATHRDKLYLVLILNLVALLAFGLGRLSVSYGEKGEFKIIYPENQPSAALLGVGGGYIASRTGGAYYFPWCASVNHISEENRLYFKTRTDAESQGFTAGNCKGL